MRFNALMLVTCKFSKYVSLIKGIDNWSAKQRAHTFLKHLELIDWGFPSKLITNRYLKFLSTFWAALFTKLGVQLLYNTVYHPQTDGLSERTNQTIEIAFCFFVYALKDSSY